MASGSLPTSLTLGCDCLGHIHYFDACSHDWLGAPKLIRNAICMHEEDFGMLWKYTDWTTGQVTVKRSRRLVISSVATIGNYVYGFFWYFYQDGTIGIEVKATGIPLANAIAPGTIIRIRSACGAGRRSPCAPAHLLLPLRHVRRWREEFRVGSEFRSTARGASEPPWQCGGHFRNLAEDPKPTPSAPWISPPPAIGKY